MRIFRASCLVAAMGLSLIGLGACSRSGDKAAPEAVANPTKATEIRVGDLVLTKYAIRATLGNGTTSAAYVTIENTGKADDILLGATCTCDTSTSLHTMSMDGGMMNMGDAPNGLPVLAGKTLILAPSGNHIMLESLKTKLNEGTTQVITLNFEKAGKLDVTMPVTNTP